MKKLKKWQILLLIFLTVLGTVGIIFGINFIRAYDVAQLTEKSLENIDFGKANKLMIVAHPDDEVIFGGGHLMDGDYLIVCITNGKNTERSSEFKKVVKKSGNQGIILSYPDKVNGKRDDWKRVNDKISADLDLIIGYKDWETIVTHNERGEYGHQHHIMTHELVTESYLSVKSDAELMFFGKYYKAVDIGAHEKDMERISDERLKYKTELAELYESQSKVVKKLWHMAPYEEFSRYGVSEE